MEDDLERIEQALTWFMRRAAQRPFHEHLMALAGVRLDRAAYSVLRRLDDCGPSRLSDLAHQLGLTVSTMSRHVQQLQAQGLVSRSEDQGDRRAAILHLTARGHELLDRVRAVRRAALAALLDRWAPEDRHQLATLLDRFVGDVDGALRELAPAARPVAGVAAHRAPGRAAGTGRGLAS